MSDPTPISQSALASATDDSASPALPPTTQSTTQHTRPTRISLPDHATDSIPQRLSGFSAGLESHPVSPSPTVVGIKTPGKSDKEYQDTDSGYFDASRSPSYGSLSGLALPHLAHEPVHNDDVTSTMPHHAQYTSEKGQQHDHQGEGEKGDTLAHALTALAPPSSSSPCPPVPGFTELERAATYATLDAEGYVRMSKPRMIFLTFAMLMTYFLGTASSTAPTLLIPSIARDLGSSLLETQWVGFAPHPSKSTRQHHADD